MAESPTILYRSRSVRHYLWPPTLWRNLWQHRDLIWQLTRREVAAMYRGASLGTLWSLLLPLAMLVVYTFVFSVVLEAKFPQAVTQSKAEFAITLFAGLLLFTVFGDCANAATTLVTAHASYVKRVVFPLEVLPVVKVGAALVNAVISLGILLVGTLVFLHRIPLTVFWLPVVALPLLLLTLGVSWFLASLGVYIRDTAQVVRVVVNLLFFTTPIFYPISQVPKPLQVLVYLNPLTAIVEDGRRVLIWGQSPNWIPLLATLVAAAAVMQLGYTWFMKTRRGFADVL